MTRPGLRTRSRRRSRVPLPSGRIGTRFKNKIGALPRCKCCGQPLAGISNSSSLKWRKSNLSSRRIMRLYGGQVCPSCLKAGLRQAIRA